MHVLARFKVFSIFIQAWDENLIGAQRTLRRLIISPPSHAYGSEGNAGKIPANTTVVFDIEVVRVSLKITRNNHVTIKMAFNYWLLTIKVKLAKEREKDNKTEVTPGQPGDPIGDTTAEQDTETEESPVCLV